MIKDFGQERFKLGRLEDIPAGEAISFYRNGEFLDLCAGTHVNYTKKIKASSSCSQLLEHTTEVTKRTNSFNAFTAQLFQQKMNYQITCNSWSEQKSVIIERSGKRWACSKLTTRVGQGLVLWKPAGATLRQNFKTL